MPLPARSEQAAARIQRELARLDAQVEAHVVDGDGLPTVQAVMAVIVPLVVVSVWAAMRQTDRTVSEAEATLAAQPAIRSISAAVEKTLKDAKRLRSQVPRLPAVQEPGESLRTFARRVGTVAALVAVARLTGRNSGSVSATRTVAQSVGVSLPRRTDGYGRMVVRTESAIRRNKLTVDVVNVKNQAAGPAVPGRPGGLDGTYPGEWAVLIEDGLNGPTDAECEEVDGQLASADWFDANPVQHQNCTRMGTPVLLEDGDVVTLL